MTDEKTKEQIYDEQVAPLLLRACKICEEAGIPMVAQVEYGDGDFGLTGWLGKAPSLAMQMILWAAQVKGNLDLLVIKAKRWNNGRPHNSVVLSMTGE
jgi:hypothetical protein